MKIKNGHILSLINLLNELKLTGKDSRMRTRFRKLLIIHQNEVVDSERKELIEEFANRDENGEIIYNDKEKGVVSIKDDFYKNYGELLNEYFVINKDEANKEMLVTVAKIMLDADYPFSGELADTYDIWCEEFESLIDYYNKEEV